MEQIEKNTTEVIRIQPTTYRGSELIDIRVWRRSRTEDKYIPTRKGLSVRPPLVKQLINGLESVIGA